VGAGRKPKGEVAGVSHASRVRFHRRFPLLVTIKVLPHVYNLRARRCRVLVEAAIRAWAERDGFRVVHYSIQGNHVHLLVEAVHRAALSRAMQGMKIKMARSLNALMERSGPVFADRYDDQVLESPRRVRHALAYVLGNARRHGLVDARVRRDWVDPCSSASVFEGWSAPVWCDRRGPPPPVAPAGTWLLARGWARSGGRLASDHVPGRPERAARG
jgi:REP element-mobilizing transposase RayT